MKWQPLSALGILVLGLVVCAILLIQDPSRFVPAYWIAYQFWLAMSLGCLGVLLLDGIMQGEWGRPIALPLASGAATIPLMAILFIPALFYLGSLFPWAKFAPEQLPEIARKRTAYLNEPFFIGRMIGYFVLWFLIGIAALRFASRRAERASLPRAWAIMGFIVLVFSGSFAMIDWIMSISMEFYSTGFSLLCLEGAMMQAIAFAIGCAVLLRGDVYTPYERNTYGQLLLMFVVLWAYLAFTHYLIIWSGNMEADASWYIERTTGGWEIPIIALMVLLVAVPFLILVVRQGRSSRRALLIVIALILTMRFVEMWWMIAPTFHHSGISFDWRILPALLTIGVAWCLVFGFARGTLAKHAERRAASHA